MIQYRTGNILECEADALVNTVNCVGVMGRGIALQFKKAFPENFIAYRKACERKEVQPGRMFLFETGQLTPPQYIINFPTKRHWRGRSRIEEIDSGLTALVKMIRERNIRSIAVPPLGSGLGGLRWADVRPRIEAALGELKEVQVIIFEPGGAPDVAKIAHTEKPPRMTPGRAVLVSLMQRYLRGLLDPFVTLLEVHKLMYFTQEAGEPLRLRFSRGSHGPYADNLRHVLHAIEGHMVTGYADGGDQPGKELKPLPKAVDEAARFLAAAEHRSTQSHLDRVATLIEGFESSLGLELLASVHWLWQQEAVAHENLVEEMHAWNEHKRVFTPRQIAIATERLDRQGWLPPHNR